MIKWKVIVISIIAVMVLAVFLSYRSYTNRPAGNITLDLPQNTPVTTNEENSATSMSLAAANASTPTPGSGSGSEIGGSADTIENIDVKTANKAGNTAGNIHSGGIIALQDSWIYFSDIVGKSYGLYRSMPDRQTGIIKLDNAVARFINVVGGWVYYYDTTSHAICRITVNGKDKTVLESGDILSMFVYEEWIYFSSSQVNNEDAGIYRMKTDGSNKSLITTMPRWSNFSLSSDGKWICFGKYNNDHTLLPLYKINVDGTNETKITDYRFIQIQVYEGWIYAVYDPSVYSSSKLVRFRPDGTDETIISDNTVSSYVINNGWIYSIEYEIDNENHSNSFVLYKMKPDGTGKILIKNNQILSMVNLSTAEDWIYGAGQPAYGQPEQIDYRIKIDGSCEIIFQEDKH